MHPIIAALAFIFSPSDDWLLKRAYELAMDPSKTPSVVQSYDQIASQFPSQAADIPALIIWSEILQKSGHFEEAQNWRNTLLKDPKISKDLADDLHIRMGEVALLDGRVDEALIEFDLAKANQGARLLDAQTDLLIVALAKNDDEKIAELSSEITTVLGPSIETSRAIFPLGLAAYSQKKYEDASEILAMMETDPRANYFLGLTYRQLGRPIDALAQWQKIRQNHPQSEWNELAQFQVAETYFNQGDDTLSRTACEKALAANPKLSKEFIFRLASLDMKHGDYQKALARLQDIQMEGDLAIRANTVMAESMVKLGLSGKMVKATAKKLPKNATPISVYQSAWANAFDLDYDKSLTAAERGLENFYDPEVTPRLLLIEAMAYENLDLRAEALATYQTLADRFPNSSSAAQGLDWLARSYMRLGRYREAVTHVGALWNQMAMNVKREHPDAALWLAEAHVKLGRYEDATQYYTDFMAMAKPESKLIPYAQFQEAMVLAKLNETPAALAQLNDFSKTAERVQNHDWIELAKVQKGNMFFNSKQFENAVVAYRASTETPKARFYEGLALYRMDYFTDAVLTWGKLAETFPDDPFTEHAMFRTGRTLFEIGKATESVAAFAAYIQKYPSNPLVKDALLQSAHALYNVGKYTEASPLYAEYLSKYRTTEDLVAVTPYLAACTVKTGKSLEEAEALLKGLPPTEILASLRWESGAKDYNEKKYEDANLLFSRLLADFPTDKNSSEANFFRAESMFMAGQWLDAEGAYNNYMNMDAEEKLQHVPLALFHKGVANYQESKLLAAAKIFETLVQKYPKDPLYDDARTNLILCYTGVGDFETRDQMKAKYGEPSAKISNPSPVASTPAKNPASSNLKRSPYLVEKDKLHIMNQEKKENVADSRSQEPANQESPDNQSSQ